MRLAGLNFKPFPNSIRVRYTEGKCADLAVAVAERDSAFKIRLIFTDPEPSEGWFIHAFLEYGNYYVDIDGPRTPAEFAAKWLKHGDFLLPHKFTYREILADWPELLTMRGQLETDRIAEALLERVYNTFAV